MLLVIIVNSVQMALYNPLTDPNSNKAWALEIIDNVTTAIFVLEALIKIITLGFYWAGPSSYMRSTWNILDFIVIIFSLVSLIPHTEDLQVFKMFRIVRALRLISRNESL